MRLLLLLVTSCLLAQAPQPVDPFAQANAFAAQYNDWGHRYSARIRSLGLLGQDVGEERSFKILEQRWQELRKQMRQQFRQERQQLLQKKPRNH